MEKYQWTPLYRRILVKREQMKQTAGGIYIPENTREMRATEGEVVLVGSECTELLPGDWVCYGKHAYHEKELDGVMYDMMNEEDVLCRKDKVVEEKPAEKPAA